MQDPAPPVSPAPTLAPGHVTVDGALLTSPSAVYQGFRAQRQELGRQMENLERSREQLTESLAEPGVTDAVRKGVEQRITSLDERIAGLDKQIADADAQVARAAGVPGAAVEPPAPPRSGPPEGAWVVGTIFIFVFFLPLSVSLARRIWRRSPKIVTTFPKELSDRLIRVEQAVEATAIEVERIGEGQRFMTRIFTENSGAHALGAGAAQPPRLQEKGRAGQ
jgi:hypothetical protein